MVTKFDEQWMPKWSQQVIKIEPLGDHCCFLGFARFWKDVFFDEFLVRQKVTYKSKISATLADKVKNTTSFGRGRRERRRAGEEKELGF